MKQIIKIKFITLIILLSNVFAILGQTYRNTTVLLDKVEKRMNNYYENAVRRESYSDIDQYYNYLYKVIKIYSPDLLNNTLKHKDNLLRALSDKKYLNKSSQIDINFILYNLCLDDYVDLVYEIFSLFQTDKISFGVVYFSIIQDGNISNQLSKNYKLPKVQRLLTYVISNVKSDPNEYYEDPISQFKLNKEAFVSLIENIKSGVQWEEIDSTIEKQQPPILKIDCNNGNQ